MGVSLLFPGRIGVDWRLCSGVDLDAVAHTKFRVFLLLSELQFSSDHLDASDASSVKLANSMSCTGVEHWKRVSKQSPHVNLPEVRDRIDLPV